MNFPLDQLDYATQVYTEYAMETDQRWFDMFHMLEEKTGLDSEDVYELIQKVQYKALYPDVSTKRR